MTSLPFRQRGLALPIMLIMLVVMLVGGIALFSSSNEANLATGSMAYQTAQARVADLGLLTAFQWLDTASKNNKTTLEQDVAASGYKATLNTNQTVQDAAFWAGSTTVDVTDAGNHTQTIEYVIHRMCALTGAYDSAAPNNTCVQTAASNQLGNATPLGSSLAGDAPEFAGSPKLHYVITARLYGVRGGNVINQLVVMIDA
jgi:hypothetical protein